LAAFGKPAHCVFEGLHRDMKGRKQVFTCFFSALLLLCLLLPSGAAEPQSLPRETQSKAPAANYELVLNLFSFNQSDDSVGTSVWFSATLGPGTLSYNASRPPGVFGLNVENLWNYTQYDYFHQDRNGTYQDARNTTAGWQFNFTKRFHGFGAIEFYPYDSWMFNITFDSPILYYANTTNLGVYVQPYLPGWNIYAFCSSGVPYPCPRLVSGNWGNSHVTLTFVIGRAAWQISATRSLPIILFLILGMSLIVDPSDLNTKVSIYAPIIIFIATYLFSLSSSLPVRTFAPSFAENVLYNLLLISSVFLAESIAEKLVAENERTPAGEAWRVVFQVLLFTALALIIANYVDSYDALLRTYFWVQIPALETLNLPLAVVLAPIIVNFTKTIRFIYRFLPSRKPSTFS
jgi:hypothetical protein